MTSAPREKKAATEKYSRPAKQRPSPAHIFTKKHNQNLNIPNAQHTNTISHHCPIYLY